MLLAPRAGHAQARYTVQPLVKAGDAVGAFPILGSFNLLGLDDAGQVAFYANEVNASGGFTGALIEAGAGQLANVFREFDPLGDLTFPGFDRPAADFNSSGQAVFTLNGRGEKNAFVQYSAGKLALIAEAGGAAPGGKWDLSDVVRYQPLRMNQKGDLLFEAAVAAAGGSQSGVFRWDAGTQQVSRVDVKGMRTASNLALDQAAPGGEAISNVGDITLRPTGHDAGWHAVGGLFLLDRAGGVQPVILDGQPLPDGSQSAGVTDSTLNDAGVVAFLAFRSSDFAQGVYRWEKGTAVSTGIVEGAPAPGGGTISQIEGVWVSPADGSLLVAALLDGASGPAGLFRFAAGQLTAAAVPGQTMPDDARNVGPPDGNWQLSPFNAAGQVAFLTSLADGSTGAYVMGVDGRLSLLLKAPSSTTPGTVTQLGSLGDPQLVRFPIGLNNHGQVALPARFGSGNAATDAILLLTPARP
jgi:hypothetical protein